MTDDQSGDAIVTAFQMEDLFVTEPDRLAATCFLDQQDRVSRLDIEEPDLSSLFVGVKGICRHLSWLARALSNVMRSL
jgi:hypothetical protein